MNAAGAAALVVAAKLQLAALPTLREGHERAVHEAKEAACRAEAARELLRSALSTLREAREVTTACVAAMATTSPPPPALAALLAFKDEVDLALSSGAGPSSETIAVTPAAERPTHPPLPPVTSPASPRSPRSSPRRPAWSGEALITTLLGSSPVQERKEQERIDARRVASRAAPASFLANVFIPAVPARLVAHGSPASSAPIVAAHSAAVGRGDTGQLVASDPAATDVPLSHPSSPESLDAAVNEFTMLLPMDPREAARLRRETLLAAETAFAAGTTGAEVERTAPWSASAQAELYLQAFAESVMSLTTTSEWSPFQACSILPEACVMPDPDADSSSPVLRIQPPCDLE